MLYKFKMNKIENNLNSYNIMVGGAEGSAEPVATPAEPSAPAATPVTAPEEPSAPPIDDTKAKEKVEKDDSLIMWAFRKNKLARGLSGIANAVIKEPCLKDLTSYPRPKTEESDIIKKIGQNFDHLGFFNWQVKGKGEFYSESEKSHITKEKLMYSLTLPTLRKMIFCVIKIAFSPLYFLYLFMVLFFTFMESLQIFNFFKGIIQIFIFIIGVLVFVISLGNVPDVLDYSLNITYKNKDKDNNFIGNKQMRPLLGVLQSLAGTVFPLQIIDRSWGHTFGYGGITILSLVIMIISTVVIIYSGISVIVIICVFINYFYKVITGLKNSATGNTSNK